MGLRVMYIDGRLPTPGVGGLLNNDLPEMPKM